MPSTVANLLHLENAVASVIRGQAAPVRILLAAFLSGGHVLLDDVPGTGKTTLAKTLARACAARFTRIQFTPDLLPSDILGVAIFNQKTSDFEFHPGPVFTHLLLADEINRASPRTQSALLEAMAEGQVSIEGQRRVLEDPFFVIATQNPVEFRGTYPLPEAQMDRFAVQLRLGYLAPEDEVRLLGDQLEGHPLERVEAVLDLEELLAIRRQVQEVTVTEEVRRYIVDLVSATRNAPGIRLGASPRASLALMKTAQALAFLGGRTFVIPDDIRMLAVPVLAHRLVLDPGAEFSGGSPRSVVEALVAQVAVPV